MTDDFRRFPASESRQIIDYNRFMTLTGEKLFICLDRGVMEIARYLLNTRGSWRTTYVKEYVGTVGYNMPTEEEFQNVLQAIAEANIDMSSCNDLVEAINGVTAAITGQGAGGCGCVGSGDTDVTDVNDNPTEPIPPTEDWEEAGFPSEEAYDSHKCNTAEDIIQGYLGTLRNWAALTGVVGGLTLAVISALLLLTVPPVGLMLILAALGILVGVDIGLLANLSLIADEIEANIETLRCDLYNSETTGDAADIMRAAAAAAVASLSLGLLEPTFLQITDNLISNEELEKLFNPAYTPSSDAECDCGAPGCDVPYEGTITWDLGTPTEIEPGYWEVVGQSLGGWNCTPAYEVAFNVGDGSPFQLCDITVHSGAVEGDTGGICSPGANVAVSNSTTGYCDAPVTPLATVGELPNGGFDYRWVVFVSCSPFTIRMRISEGSV